MSCYNGCDCGCNNTVQFAPPACNPNFPTTCYPLGEGTIQRIVGEDSSSCKFTVPALASNSILFYNASTALVNWADGSSAAPIFLGNGSGQSTASASCQIQATTPTGQLVTFKPNTSTKTQFPIVSPSGTTTNWGTIDNIVPSQGIVYKNSSGTVAELTGTSSQIVSFDGSGNPVAVSGTTFGVAIPTGAVMAFAANIVPTGWLLCDGSIYTISAYPTLGALLTQTYGGSAGTTFGVPNLQGIFIRGSGSQTQGGVTYSSASIGSVQADQFQGHYHSNSATTNANRASGTGSVASGTAFALVGSSVTVSVTAPTNDGTNGNPRTGTETRPANLAMVYCIKT